AGDRLLLIPDPPGADDPAVWVHLRDGDPVGHLPPEINAWLAPWMMRGGSASAIAVRVGGSDVPSWKRLLIAASCGTAPRRAPPERRGEPRASPRLPPSEAALPERDHVVHRQRLRRVERLPVLPPDQRAVVRRLHPPLLVQRP